MMAYANYIADDSIMTPKERLGALMGLLMGVVDVSTRREFLEACVQELRRADTAFNGYPFNPSPQPGEYITEWKLRIVNILRARIEVL
jgi:hypothetical protein